MLDLAFVLPLCVVAGIRLLRNRAAARLALPLLVFTPLLSTGVLSISAFAATTGQPLETVQLAIFVVITTVSIVLAWLGLRPNAVGEVRRQSGRKAAAPVGAR